MERYLERSPSEEELNEKFIPGISFHFRYDDVIKYKGYIFDGYHPAKIKDGFNLEELLYLCVIPQSLKSEFDLIIPKSIKNRVIYIEYEGEGLIKWNEKVYDKISSIDSVDNILAFNEEEISDSCKNNV